MYILTLIRSCANNVIPLVENTTLVKMCGGAPLRRSPSTPRKTLPCWGPVRGLVGSAAWAKTGKSGTDGIQNVKSQHTHRYRLGQRNTSRQGEEKYPRACSSVCSGTGNFEFSKQFSGRLQPCRTTTTMSLIF